MNRNIPTVLVTGAATGIGFATARAFLARGFQLVLNGRRHSKLLEAARSLGAPERVVTVAADVTRTDDAARIVQTAIDAFGRLDVLVNNAGIFQMKPFTDYSVDELDAYLGYLRGTFVLTQHAVRAMRAGASGGAIVNIGTILALNGIAGLPSSAPMAAKGGITALTKNLSIELAADNIRINAVAPGVVPTPLYGELGEDERKRLHDLQPLGRYGRPEEIADAVVYLATAEWVTGVILPVDGGVDAGGDGATRRSAPPARAAAS
jgi:NAD(P)-dependent dehydrogenase (short-subunit alcohol dehydrogenase family)